MRSLVTGAAGFIGSHVVRALLHRGHAVRALVLPRDDRRNLRGLDVELVEGDVTDEAAVARAVANMDLVFHLAAIYALWLPDPALMHRVNVDGTRNVLRAALRAGVRRVVHTSSFARFAGQGAGQRATEDSPWALGVTGDHYSQTKHDAHCVAEEAAAAGQDVVIVAPCAPIGPGDVGPTPTGRLLLTSLQAPVVAVSAMVSNVAHVRDMAEGHALAAERGIAGRSYMLGHRDLSGPELAHMAMRVTGRSRPVVEIPHAAALLGRSVASRVAATCSGTATCRGRSSRTWRCG